MRWGWDNMIYIGMDGNRGDDVNATRVTDQEGLDLG